MTRILILTAAFGEGHNAAARALASGVDRVFGPNTARVADAFALASPRLNRLACSAYLRLINDAPRVWSRFYDWIDRSQLMPRGMFFFRGEIRALAQLIAEERPAAICSTYPLYAFFLEHLARRQTLNAPLFNIVTDSISIHSLWWRARCDGWFLPNADSAAVLRSAGIDARRLHVCGFPVPAIFANRPRSWTPPNLTASERPRVLHIINSGTRHAEETAELLLRETDWRLTFAVGRDTRLRTRLEKLASGRRHPVRVLGWTDQIPRLLMTHHVVISKAGGATTQEAIAALCPMIVSQVVPGQEEGNYELLRRHRAGTLATTPPEVLAALRGAFARQGRVWREWRNALRALAQPHAADEIASRVLAVTGPGVSRVSRLSPAAVSPTA